LINHKNIAGVMNIMKYFLFPAPAKAEFASAHLDCGNARWVKISPDFSPGLKKAVAAFVATVNSALPRPLEITAGVPSEGDVLVTLGPINAKLNPQHYRLYTAGHGIRLEGGDEAAVFYGLQTLAQLLTQTGVFIPEFKIDDAPDFANRGFMLDVSRCKVPTMETLFQLIDMLAVLKFNQLQLYMEHTFAFAAHERVWSDSSPFSAQEIIEIDQYCRERFIELVPNFNSFGHLERWLKLDEYKHMAECPDGFVSQWGDHRVGGVLKPNEESLVFLNSLYSEMLPNFTSCQLNIGCDETWELGQGWSKEQCEKQGKTRVYLNFLLKVADLAAKHGRRVMFWGDIILHQPELIAELPKNITALNWGYEADHPFAEQTAKFSSSGVPFYVCPGTSSWNSLTGRTENCLKNLANAAKYGRKNGAAGYLITDWGDGGHHQYPAVSWLGITAGACFSWNYTANRNNDWAWALDYLWSHDQAGVIGDYLLEFGRICDCFAPMHNCTIYGKALWKNFENMAADAKNVKSKDLKKALQKTLELRERLKAALPAGEDAGLLMDELYNGSYMVEAGLIKMLLIKGKEVELQEMLDLYRRFIGKHSQLWLARNRPGGLYESSKHLRGALEELIEHSRQKKA